MAKNSGRKGNVAYETPAGIQHNSASLAGREVLYHGPPAEVGTKQRVERGPGESVNSRGLLRRFSSKRGK